MLQITSTKEYLLAKIPTAKSWVPKSGSMWSGTTDLPLPVQNKKVSVRCDELGVPVRIPIIESAPYDLYGMVTYKPSDQPPMVDIRVDDVRCCYMPDTWRVESQETSYPVFVPKGSKLELTAITKLSKKLERRLM